jgi:hypothetical protein
VTLDVLSGSFAICRLAAGAPVPEWAWRASFSSVTRTPGELSIICAEDGVPLEVAAQRAYRGLIVRGPLDFGEIGIVAALSAPLAAASISIFVVSTYDTDYLFISGDRFARAIEVLREAGHRVVSGA